MREWGIYPEGKNPKQWWGARAIIEKDLRISLLPDRQSYERDDTVSDQEREEMLWWMSLTIEKQLQEMAKAQKFQTWDDYVTLESEDGRFHCEATPKNSGGGYLYIGCWQIK